MNNADLAIAAMRKTQEKALDRNTSPNSMVTAIEQDIQRVAKASKQINTYEEQMNRMINVLNKKNMFNTEIIAAFTGLSLDQAKAFEGKLNDVKDIEEAQQSKTN